MHRQLFACMDSNSLLTFGVMRCTRELRVARPCLSVDLLFCGVEIYCLSEWDLENL
jgi:hypothetical protein